jgi:group II intron reverse transcriptase/maturase
MERRAKHATFTNKKQPKGMIDYEETKTQPISRKMVWQAYWQVRANKGSSGIDKVDWTYFDKHRNSEIYKIWNRLTSGSYMPQAVKRVAIPKKGGGNRYLGIPTLTDRIAQEVARAHLEKQVEPLFHNSSYGYRPGRNCHQAVQQAYENAWRHDFAIDLDIKGFFDNIDHELLIKAVSHYCKDKWVIMYVKRWLKAGIFQEDRTITPNQSGTPQGGVISPLLANIFLHVVFDKWMEKYQGNILFERYADDIIVHCKTEKQAHYLLGQIKRRMETCKLQLQPEKTQIINLFGRAERKYSKNLNFLGFTISPRPHKCKNDKIKTIPVILVSQKSKTSIGQKIRSMQIHKLRTTIEHVARIINPVIRGIINYYHKFNRHDMRLVWQRLNVHLLKWVKWEKRLRYKEARKYLRTKYREKPRLFTHWQMVYP